MHAANVTRQKATRQLRTDEPIFRSIGKTRINTSKLLHYLLMKKRHYPVQTLTEPEANKARALTEKYGLKQATRLLGLYDEATLCKAIARIPVSPLTAGLVRANLANKL